MKFLYYYAISFLLIDLVIGNETPTDLFPFPVCATSGTFATMQLFLEAHEQDHKIKLLYRGNCRNPIVQPYCECEDKDRPICGNDDRDYENACVFNCFRRMYPNLEVLKGGKCRIE